MVNQTTRAVRCLRTESQQEMRRQRGISRLSCYSPLFPAFSVERGAGRAAPQFKSGMDGSVGVLQVEVEFRHCGQLWLGPDRSGPLFCGLPLTALGWSVRGACALSLLLGVRGKERERRNRKRAILRKPQLLFIFLFFQSLSYQLLPAVDALTLLICCRETRFKGSSALTLLLGYSDTGAKKKTHRPLYGPCAMEPSTAGANPMATLEFRNMRRRTLGQPITEPQAVHASSASYVYDELVDRSSLFSLGRFFFIFFLHVLSPFRHCTWQIRSTNSWSTSEGPC